MYLPRIIARIGLFSNVGRFMIIEKPQKLFFPTFVSDYNNPERYRNKDMKVNLNKGAIEGLFLEQAAAASSRRAGPRISSFSSHASPTSGKRRS